MFSVRSLTSVATSASRSIESGVKVSVTPSVERRAVYCRTSAFFGSVRIRTKSSRPSGSSSTRIGKRPCSSGMRSEGFETWNAPAAMNRM
jgi:hypothetical protein